MLLLVTASHNVGFLASFIRFLLTLLTLLSVCFCSELTAKYEIYC